MQWLHRSRGTAAGIFCGTYRESLSPRRAGRGRHAAKRSAGEGLVPDCAVCASSAPHPPVGTFSPAEKRGGEGLSMLEPCHLYFTGRMPLNRLLMTRPKQTYRESLSPRRAGRGRHAAKRSAGEGSCPIAQSAQARPPHPPVGTFSPAEKRGGEGLSMLEPCHLYFTGRMPLSRLGMTTTAILLTSTEECIKIQSDE